MFLFYRCIFFLSRNIPSSFNTSIYSNLFVIYLSVGLVSIPLYSMLQNIWILIMSCIACVRLYDAVSIIWLVVLGNS